MKKLIIVCFVLLVSLLLGNENYYISGSVYSKKRGPIYIFLVNAEVFHKPMQGLQRRVLYPNKSGCVFYRFINLKKGIYGIRCFQDLNQNKKLDKGAFGPTEPWGMSWNKKKIFRWPRFSSISFSVNKNRSIKDIHLK